MKHKSVSPRSRRGHTRRQVDRIPVRQSFLIVCEGERTEPDYFQQFRAPGLVVQVAGTGYNTLSLVKEAMRRMGQDEPFDQVWCVFDRDSNPVVQFNAAIELAGRNGIDVAYSNQAFELWYLLHFQYLDTALHRKDYIQRLSARLGHPYRKNDPQVYAELLPFRDEALRNAQRLLAQYRPARPAEDDPSTTVHLLVEQLTLFAGPIFG